MTDLFTADFTSLSNEMRYSAIADFAQALPFESSRHDFKETWDPKVVEDVAAFANTFGGILIIGVRKGAKDLNAVLVGVESKSELTTRIASSIATNISPIPYYEVLECYSPDTQLRRFCVIRVRSSFSVHLVTKKGTMNPAFIRNEDQTVPVDAARLRMMIDREKQSVGNIDSELLDRARGLLHEVTVSHGPGGPEPWPHGECAVSPTFLKLALVPNHAGETSMDVLNDQKFVQLIYSHYPRVLNLLNDRPSPAKEGSDRRDDLFDYRWFHSNLAYESRWRITNKLDIVHAVQNRIADEWSLVDLVVYSMLLLEIGGRWWKYLGFLGDGILVAHLSVSGLKLRQAGSNLTHGFDPGVGSFRMSALALDRHPYPRESANGHVRVNFTNMREEVPAVVTSLMNSLLRSLGHGLRGADFEADASAIWKELNRVLPTNWSIE